MSPLVAADHGVRATDRLADRLASRSERRGDCLVWVGALTRCGYGKLKVDGKNRRAHRMAYLVDRGEVPPVGMVVCHTCDVPSRIEPSHLYAGTHADNMDDRRSRGRTARVRGEDRAVSKLTEAGVISIRERIAAGDQQKSIAADMGVSEATVSGIKSRKVWGWL